MHIRLIIIVAALTISTIASASVHQLRQRLEALIGNHDVALALRCAGGDTLSINGNEARELASAMKFFQAAALAHNTPYENLVSDSVIITETDLHKDTWSPLRASVDKLPLALPPAALLHYSLAMSDNNAADILFDRYLPPLKVDSTIRCRYGIENFAVRHTEAEMHADPRLSAHNYSSAIDATDLIYRFFTGDTIAEATLVKAIMGSDTPFGRERIMAGINNSAAKVFHKTGTGFDTPDGRTSTINDLSFVSYPTHHGYSCYALGIFVKDFDGTRAEAEKLIADLSAAVWGTIIVDQVAIMNRNVNSIGIKKNKKIEPYPNDEWKEALFDATMTAILEAVIGD